MKILLLQFRPDQTIAQHEFDLILKYSDRPESDFVRVDTTRQEASLNLLDGIDALILGGSGDYLISRGDIPEILVSVTPLIEEVRRRKIPTLGICFGAQIITHVLGGRVENDESRAEVGTFVVTKSEVGDQDPLFAFLPKQFDVQLGHKDHLTVLPDGAVHLASSDRSWNQAWSFPNEPFYALTFHPELDIEGTMYRVNYYAQEYKITPETISTLRESLRESPEANEMIKKFLSTFCAVDKTVDKDVEESWKTQ